MVIEDGGLVSCDTGVDINDSIYRELTYWKVTNYICSQLLEGRVVKYSKESRWIYSWNQNTHDTLKITSIAEIMNSETGFEA